MTQEATMSACAERCAAAISKLYEEAAKLDLLYPKENGPSLGEEITDLRDEIGHALGLAGLCSAGDFISKANTIVEGQFGYTPPTTT